MADEFTHVVYAPPTAGFPYLAVVFGVDGQVVSATTVSSQEAGETLIREVAQAFARHYGREAVSKKI